MDKNQQKSTLSARQERLLTMLLSSATVTAATKRAGINRATFYGWLREPAFARALQERQSSLYASAAAEVKAMLSTATKELGTLLKSHDERTRLAAVREVLDRTTTILEHQTLTERIETLEQQIEKMEAK